MRDVKRLYATCLGLWAFCFFAAWAMDVGCAENVPTNETDVQPIAGTPAIEDLSLSYCYTHNARLQVMDSGSAIMYGTPRQCETVYGGANCYDRPAPWYGAQMFQLRWGVGSGNPVSSQAAELWIPQGNLPAVHTYNLQCSCASCTAHRLVP